MNGNARGNMPRDGAKKEIEKGPPPAITINGGKRPLLDGIKGIQP